MAGDVDSRLIGAIRFFIASLLLTPLLKKSSFKLNIFLPIFIIGAIQIGLMSIFFYKSFAYLKIREVLLFTLMTPLYINIFGDLLQKKMNAKYFMAAFFSIIGALVIKWQNLSELNFTGIFIIQICNICFALGQVMYKHYITAYKNKYAIELKDKEVFAFFHYGAFFLTATSFYFLGNKNLIPHTQAHMLSLLWLAVFASAIGYYLWNSGAREVNYGVLAAINNLIVPLGIVVSLFFPHEAINWPRFIAGAMIIYFSILLPKFDISKYKIRH